MLNIVYKNEYISNILDFIFSAIIYISDNNLIKEFNDHFYLANL